MSDCPFGGEGGMYRYGQTMVVIVGMLGIP